MSTKNFLIFSFETLFRKFAISYKHTFSYNFLQNQRKIIDLKRIVKIVSI